MIDSEQAYKEKRFPCPCCGQNTLEEEPPGSYEICPVCGWEDDLVQYRNPGLTGGANVCSLEQAREDYQRKRRAEEPME